MTGALQRVYDRWFFSITWCAGCVLATAAYAATGGALW